MTYGRSLACMATIECNGWAFDVDDSGGSGEPILLLHGFPQDHTSWNQLVGPLREAGYRTIAPDQRGYSPGARPTDTKAYRLGEVVGDALAILDALDIERAHIVGHDWGGAVAWGLAASAPDRVRTLTVLSTPHPAAMQKAVLRSTQGLRSWYMGLFQVPGLAERLMAPGRPMWSALMRGLPPESQQHYSENAQDPQARRAMLQWYRAVPGEVLSPSVDWHRIQVPTLYVWGERDPALGSVAAHATAEFVAGSYTFVALPGQGHWLPERAAAEVAPLLLDHLQGQI